MVGGGGWQALRPKVGGVVDVVTRKSRGCARRRMSRRVSGSVWIRLQFSGCSNVVVTRGTKAKTVSRRVYGVGVGVVSSRVRSGRRLGLLACLGLGVRPVGRQQQRLCTKSCRVSDCDFWHQVSLTAGSARGRSRIQYSCLHT